MATREYEFMFPRLANGRYCVEVVERVPYLAPDLFSASSYRLLDDQTGREQTFATPADAWDASIRWKHLRQAQEREARYAREALPAEQREEGARGE